MPRLVAPPHGVPVGEVHPGECVRGPVLLALYRRIATVPTLWPPNGVAPPVYHLLPRTAVVPILQPDFRRLLLTGFRPHPGRLIVAVEFVEVGQVEAVALGNRRRWACGRRPVAAVVMAYRGSYLDMFGVRNGGKVFKLLLQLSLFEDLRRRLDVAQCAPHRGQAYLCTAAAPIAAVAGAVGVSRGLAVAGAHARGVSDRELRYRSHLSGHPAGQDFASLLLAEAGPGKITPLNKGYNVNDYLVLVQDGVDDHGYKRGQVGLAPNFDDYDDQTASLEDSTNVTC